MSFKWCERERNGREMKVDVEEVGEAIGVQDAAKAPSPSQTAIAMVRLEDNL